MSFVCEDLARHGVVLVPPSSHDYDMYLADIQRRVSTPVEGSPPFPEGFRPRIVPTERSESAILLNRSAKSIAGLQVVWRFETLTGRTFRHASGMLSPRSLLLPFNPRNESIARLENYWHTIFPGSKRYLGESGIVGDNTDVRPPTDDEKWRGGIVTGRGGGGGRSRDPIRQVTLVLDGVFFLDGEFVGPDREKMFEEIVAESEAHRAVAKIATDGKDHGLSAAEILAQIEQATGVPPDTPPMPPHLRNAAASHETFRAAALQAIASLLALQRRYSQAEQIVSAIIAWNDVVLPNFRKAGATNLI